MGILDDEGENPNYLLEDVPYHKGGIRLKEGKGSKWAEVPLYIGILVMCYLSFKSIRWGAIGFMLLLVVWVPLCGLVHEYNLRKNRGSTSLQNTNQMETEL